MIADAEQPRWTPSTIEVDGRRVRIETSNVPPPGTPRRIYWFATPPESIEGAASIVAHIEDLHTVAEQADGD